MDHLEATDKLSRLRAMAENFAEEIRAAQHRAYDGDAYQEVDNAIDMWNVLINSAPIVLKDIKLNCYWKG